MNEGWATNGGFYLGYAVDRTQGKPSLGPELSYAGNRPIIVIGPTGSGKSRHWLMPNLARLTGWSIIVVDAKGDLMWMLKDRRAAAGNEQIIFNPFKLFGVPSRGINPLAALDPQKDEFLDDAMEQAVGFIEVGNTRETHWPESYQNWFAALMMYVRLVIPGGTYEDVRALTTLDDTGTRRLIYAGTKDEMEFLNMRDGSAAKEAPDRNPPFEYRGGLYPGMIAAGIKYGWPEIGQKATQFAALSAENRELQSILSTGRTKTRVFDSRPIKRDLAGPNFDFAELKQRPMTVWLTLPDNRLHTHADWLRLMINTAIRCLMREAKPGPVPVALIVDDANAIGYSALIEATNSQIRGYGFKSVMIFHDLAEFKDTYRRWESMLGNAGVVQSFAAQDLTTSEYLSKRTGFKTDYDEQRTTGQNLPQKGSSTSNLSASITPFQIQLMLPQDIWHMDDGYTVLFTRELNGRKIKQTVRSFLPSPTELPGLEAICALDPAG